MEWINDFHKKWIEQSLQSIEYWKKHPMSLEDAKKQQEMLNRQKAERKAKHSESQSQLGKSR